MGGFRIIEDRPTPKAVYNFRIYLFSAVACESWLLFVCLFSPSSPGGKVNFIRSRLSSLEWSIGVFERSADNQPPVPWHSVMMEPSSEQPTLEHRSRPLTGFPQ